MMDERTQLTVEQSSNRILRSRIRFMEKENKRLSNLVDALLVHKAQKS